MTYKHSPTGLIFERTRGASPVRITGNTFPHKRALQAAGFTWNKSEEQWEGEASDLSGLSVLPEGFRIMSGLEIQTKNKIGGGIKILSL